MQSYFINIIVWNVYFAQCLCSIAVVTVKKHHNLSFCYWLFPMLKLKKQSPWFKTWQFFQQNSQINEEKLIARKDDKQLFLLRILLKFISVCQILPYQFLRKIILQTQVRETDSPWCPDYFWTRIYTSEYIKLKLFLKAQIVICIAAEKNVSN